MFLAPLVALSLTAGPNAAFASERAAFVRQRALGEALPRRARFDADPFVSPVLDYQRYDVQLQWDFRTGAVTGSATLVVRAGTLEGVVPLIIDSGVTAFTAADASGPLPLARESIGGDLDVIQVVVPIGSTDVTLTLTWSGTLRCGTGLGTPACSRGSTSYGWMDHRAGVPLPFDPAAGLSTDRVLRSWSLRTPLGFQVFVAGDLVSQSDTATEHLSTWTTQQPVALALSSWIITGTALVSVPSALAGTDVVHTGSSRVADVARWAETVLPLEAARFGPRLSPGVAQVMVPRSSSFIGTASYAMTLINESYDVLGPLEEEVWAHENIHQHFAVRAYPRDTQVCGLMTEGITTLLELDYTNRALSGFGRDHALAGRFNEFGLVIDYRFPQVLDLPLSLGDAAQMPRDPYVYNAWGYFKGASTLDVLRLWVGEAAFDDALNRYLRACDAAPCDTATFQQSLEAASGRAMGPFFSEWVFGARRRELQLGFHRTADGVEVEAVQPADGLLPVELWLERYDGTVQREGWTLQAAREQRRFTSAAEVRAVRVNPRTDALVRIASVVPGDVDFDGENDGFDVIACARLSGLKLDSPGPRTGIWGLNLDFDRRCDLDHDGAITMTDVASLPFGAPRSSP